MKGITIASVLLATVLLTGCNQQHDHQIHGTLTHVGIATDFDLNNTPAVSIILSKDTEHYLTISLNQHSLQTLLAHQNTQNFNQKNNNIDANLTWDGHYIIDKSRASGIVLDLEYINKTTHSAKIHYTATLVNAKKESNKTIELSDSFTLAADDLKVIQELSSKPAS
ncbi:MULTISPECIES: hypothetical protein [unclassified Photobacterium]|uniref:hypothetical protein n=1 Tax=unclassified Photobacterium TaxID=2628852 RepID=UPI000D16579D|nr:MULTISPECIES: hypothetical protein [unclassified Photobacterium]PSV28613.1 hypothetical protein C9J40_18915 [Photobacterium sp. GB-72]PSV34565.1 hypothetical protein C9J38_17615 [Photobacterium sp. GB-210]PSV53827.1 hypothetical protein C9J45_07165 [Photobacterium sp. GB-1]